MSIPAFVYVAVVSCVVLVLVAAAVASLVVVMRGHAVLGKRQRRGVTRDDTAILLKSPLAPAITVVAVPPDASPASIAHVQELVKLHYGDHEVLLMLDGPPETELAVWTREFALYPSSRAATGSIPAGAVRGVYESLDPIRLMVVEKDAGGVADCLNVALNLTGAPLIAVADPAASLACDALLRAVRPFLEDPDLTLAACALAPPRAGNGALELGHVLDATTAWFGRAAGLDHWQATLPAPGSMLLVKRSAAIAVNGFFSTAFEMVLHLHVNSRVEKLPYRIAFVPEDVAVERPAASNSERSARLKADQREMLRAVARHQDAMFNFGGLGMVALPGLLWRWALAPVVELLLLALLVPGLALGLLAWPLAVTAVLVVLVPGIFEAMLVVLLRELRADPPVDSGTLVRLLTTAVTETGWRLRARLLLVGGLPRCLFGRRSEMQGRQMVARPVAKAHSAGR